MCVDHRRVQVFMAEQLLQGANVAFVLSESFRLPFWSFWLVSVIAKLVFPIA
jgi:hypothetical protein